MNKTRKATMDDIAKQLNISKNSVSLALNNKNGVGDELRKKIIETARQMQYGIYSGTECDKSNCIILIVPEYLQNDTFFYFDIFWAIEKEAKEDGYLSIITSISKTAEQELILPNLTQEMNIFGFLVIGILNEQYLQKLHTLNYPIITVDIPYPSVPVTSIYSANLTGGYTATKYLIDAGHKEIGFIGPIYSAQSVYERWCGFSQALMNCGLTQHSEYNILGEKGSFHLLDTAEALEPYLNEIKNLPTAWFCAGDRIAITLIQLLAKRSFNVPEDISIIGFDDINLAQVISPPLTTIHVDRKYMGRLAVKQLIQRHKAKDCDETFHIILPCRLIPRNSVKHI
jgi:LacI family transcriptional regulator/LacI family purine nucleotide synthesis repressor